MMDKLKKVLGEKKSKLSDVQQEAKMKVMQALSDEMGGAMKEKLKGLKKVTVASNSSQGLKKGLEKAEQIVAGGDSGDSESECSACKGKGCPSCDNEMPSGDHAMGENGDEEREAQLEDAVEEQPDEEMTPADIDAKIAELQNLKKQKLKV